MTLPSTATGGPATEELVGNTSSAVNGKVPLQVGGLEAEPDEREESAALSAPCQDVHTVPVSELLPADSPRLAGEDDDHTRRLIEANAELPPILVHRMTMRVIDGMHRLRAAMACGMQEIRVRFFDGDENEAFLQAVRENIAHGLPLAMEDRRDAARRIIHANSKLSSRAIARYTGLSDKTISVIRERSSAESSRSSKRVGVDGRARPLNNIEGRRRAVEFVTARPDASLREIAMAAGISVGTAHDVRTQMRRGEDPVSRRTDADPPNAITPGSGEGIAAQRPARHVADFDPGKLLEKLVQDPAIRQAESGRLTLRWLHNHVVRETDINQLVAAIPPHRTEGLIMLAKYCAWVWDCIVERLAVEQRSNDDAGFSEESEEAAVV